MLRWYVGRSKLRKEEWLYNQLFAFPAEISPTFAHPGSFEPYLSTDNDHVVIRAKASLPKFL